MAYVYGEYSHPVDASPPSLSSHEELEKKTIAGSVIS